MKKSSCNQRKKIKEETPTMNKTNSLKEWIPVIASMIPITKWIYKIIQVFVPDLQIPFLD